MAIQSRQPSMPGTCNPAQGYCATGRPNCPCGAMRGYYDPDSDGDTDTPGTPDDDTMPAHGGIQNGRIYR